MALVTLPSSDWVDILSFSGVSPADDTVLRNYGSSTVLVAVQATAPTVATGFPVLIGDMVSVHNVGQKIWVKGVAGVKLWVDHQQNNVVSLYSDVSVQEPLNVIVPEPLLIELPPEMITGTPGDPLGSRRLRTDQGQTSFWQGKQYRTFQELNIAGGAVHTIRIVTGVNTILKSLSLNIVTGDARMSIISGGTAGGTFGTTLPIIRKNSMTVTPNVPSQNVITSGGTVTGGTLLDVIRVVAADATGSHKEASVGANQDDERGVGPGTFFYRIEAIGTSALTGVINFFWEER